MAPVLHGDPGEHRVSPLPRRVRRVEDRHVAVARLEPADRVVQRSLHAVLPTKGNF